MHDSFRRFVSPHILCQRVGKSAHFITCVLCCGRCPSWWPSRWSWMKEWWRAGATRRSTPCRRASSRSATTAGRTSSHCRYRPAVLAQSKLVGALRQSCCLAEPSVLSALLEVLLHTIINFCAGRCLAGYVMPSYFAASCFHGIGLLSKRRESRMWPCTRHSV